MPNRTGRKPGKEAMNRTSSKVERSRIALLLGATALLVGVPSWTWGQGLPEITVYKSPT